MIIDLNKLREQHHSMLRSMDKMAIDLSNDVRRSFEYNGQNVTLVLWTAPNNGRVVAHIEEYNTITGTGANEDEAIKDLIAELDARRAHEAAGATAG